MPLFLFTRVDGSNLFAALSELQLSKHANINCDVSKLICPSFWESCLDPLAVRSCLAGSVEDL